MTPARTVTVCIRRVYSNAVIYPADANAKFFAAIAGTKTLTVPALQQIKNLGFEIVEKVEPQLKGI